MKSIAPMFDEEEFKRDVRFALIHADDREGEILDIALRYYTQVLARYNLAFLEAATQEFKSSLASMLVAASRRQELPNQPDKPDESVDW